MAQEEVLVAGHSSDSPSEPRRAQSLANHASRQFALADPPTTSSLAETLKDRRTSTDNQASTPWASAANQEAPVDPAGTDIEGANETDDTKHAFHQHYSEDISVESRYLRRSTGSITKEIAFGLLGFLLALMFIVLTALAVSLNGKEVSDYGSRIVTWSSIGPSIYPIIFAAIVARCFKKIAGWQAERGTSLAVLERLTASSSLAGSVQTAFSLRRLTPTAVLILLIWALSPIGGQSSLRLLSVVQRPVMSSHSIYYTRSDTTYYIGGSSHYDTTPLATNAIFGASLLAGNSTKFGPTDSWSNPKVPLLQTHIDTIDSLVDDASNPWIDAPAPSSNVTYGSLVGQPLLNVPQNGAVNFSMETITIYTDCKRLKTPVTKENWCKLSQSVVPFTCRYYSNGLPNCSDQSFLLNSSYVGLGPLLNASDAPQYVDIQFIGGGMQYLYGNASGFSCDLKSLRLEANVLCDSGQCAVKRVRRSQFDRRPSFLTPWNEFAPNGGEDGAPSSWYTFVQQLSTSAGTAFQSYATPLDNYLYGLDTPFTFNYAFDWHNVSEAAFSQRFTTVVNTFWTAAQFSYSVAGNIFQKPDRLTVGNPGPDGQPDGGYNVTTGVVTNHDSVYHAHPLWVTFLFVISALLLVFSGISTVIGILTLAPDILGHVSSLVRDSPFIRKEAGTWMDGGQQARQLQDLRVQIADIHPEADVGSIAFTHIPSEFAPASALRRDRLYQ